MVCDKITLETRTRLDLKGADLRLLAKAVGMMEGVAQVQVEGKRIMVRMSGGGWCALDIREDQVVLEGRDSEQIKRRLTQYYTAIVQYETLRLKGYEMSMRREGERLRIQARR